MVRIDLWVVKNIISICLSHTNPKKEKEVRHMDFWFGQEKALEKRLYKEEEEKEERN